MGETGLQGGSRREKTDYKRGTRKREKTVNFSEESHQETEQLTGRSYESKPEEKLRVPEGALTLYN